MRHFVLLFLVLGALAIGAYFSWTGLHHPAGRIEEITEPGKIEKYKINEDIITLAKERGCQIIETGMLFGSRGLFEDLHQDLVKTDNPYQLLSGDSIIYRAQLDNYGSDPYNSAGVYWTKSFYFFEKVPDTPSDWWIADGKLYRLIGENAWSIGILIAAEAGLAMGIFFLVERKLFAKNW